MVSGMNSPFAMVGYLFSYAFAKVEKIGKVKDYQERVNFTG